MSSQKRQQKNDKNTSRDTGDNVVTNARIATGLEQILRCGSTDVFSKLVSVPDDSVSRRSQLLKGGTMDSAILQRAGLILDLRSPSERNEKRAQLWMSSAAANANLSNDNTTCSYAAFAAHEFQLPHKKYSEEELQSILDQNMPRVVIRLDILSPTRFMAYLEEHWWSPAEKAQANLLRNSTSSIHTMRIKTLNQRGLLGLNEAILETGQQGLCTALQLMTLFMERIAKEQQQQNLRKDPTESPSSSVYNLIVIHCVQGKDRTGLLVMLCQAIMGISEADMVRDYHRSHGNLSRRGNRRKKQAFQRNDNTTGETSAAMERVIGRSQQQQQKQQQQPPTAAVTTKWDPSIFLGAPREIMESTLEYLNFRYGSVVPGYLDHIGFHETWQNRFQRAQQQTTFVRQGATSSRL